MFHVAETESLAYKEEKKRRRLLYYAMVLKGSQRFQDQEVVPVLSF